MPSSLPRSAIACWYSPRAASGASFQATASARTALPRPAMPRSPFRTSAPDFPPCKERADPVADAVKPGFPEAAPINYARRFERVALLVVWILLIAVFGAAMPGSFLSWGSFSIMFASYAPAALLALAIIVPLTAGDYDLAVGATLTLSSSLIGVLNVWQHLPIGLVLVIVLAAGVVVGLVHAVLILYYRVPSLVVTLGTTSLMSGLVQWITNSSTIGGID